MSSADAYACSREDSNPHCRLRRPTRYPLHHRSVVPAGGPDPPPSCLSRRRSSAELSGPGDVYGTRTRNLRIDNPML